MDPEESDTYQVPGTVHDLYVRQANIKKNLLPAILVPGTFYVLQDIYVRYGDDETARDLDVDVGDMSSPSLQIP